ncbi:hypothetical protein [Chenggangzhangella methanolivorans]|uniref:Uncharacterized protein n=1 Tax=Chenggangzhangella methanolivorans TaxID=1437009 RepID=A0A9E6RAT1_9HYPH|nr:hypothetical protein [Chenggangzhangella methanolivorans]QZN99802.1 hypothetical protein K6K41_24585 [Chenggangzhangella methanolivorans]
MSGPADYRAEVQSLRAQLAGLAGLPSQYVQMGMSLSGQSAQIAALQEANAALSSSVAQLVSPASFTVKPTAQTIGAVTYQPLPAANAATVGKYARVVDLFSGPLAAGSGLTDLLLCQAMNLNGVVTYYWRPLRKELCMTMPAAADTTLKALESPSEIVLTGNILAGVTRRFTLSTDRVFPGHSYRIKTPTLGLGSSLQILSTLNGVVGSLLQSIGLSGAVMSYSYDVSTESYVAN